jgi:hypothetical protein
VHYNTQEILFSSKAKTFLPSYFNNYFISGAAHPYRLQGCGPPEILRKMKLNI